mmetsp:Transcript_23943/g.62591  ORF Transcript_23943/g.62591 Transcript_23943/m.62591 type:complete len:263 (+) Transcript_23943:572-1360(+)
MEDLELVALVERHDGKPEHRARSVALRGVGRKGAAAAAAVLAQPSQHHGGGDPGDAVHHPRRHAAKRAHHYSPRQHRGLDQRGRASPQFTGQGLGILCRKHTTATVDRRGCRSRIGRLGRAIKVPAAGTHPERRCLEHHAVGVGPHHRGPPCTRAERVRHMENPGRRWAAQPGVPLGRKRQSTCRGVAVDLCVACSASHHHRTAVIRFKPPQLEAPGRQHKERDVQPLGLARAEPVPHSLVGGSISARQCRLRDFLPDFGEN